MQKQRFNSVVWFEIYVQDMARARAFYEAVFAIKLENMPNFDNGMEMLAFPSGNSEEVMLPGAAGTLVKMDGVSSGAGGVMVYFHSDDCTTELARVEAAGGKVIQNKTEIGNGFGNYALIQDTEGNMIGLHSMQ